MECSSQKTRLVLRTDLSGGGELRYFGVIASPQKNNIDQAINMLLNGQ